jgi:glycosyltransferase involved in cell wall biosynthesis
LEVTIGIPAYNEEKNIASIIVKLKKISSRIIVCNDGSTDSTGLIAKELGAMVINHQKNQGYGAAIKSIFLKAKEIGSEVLVTLDADGQHDVNEIDKLLKPITDDKSDVVIGSRFLGETENVPSYRKLGINVITKLTNASIKKNLTDSQSGFRAYNKKVIEQVQLSESGMGVSTEILIKASSKEFRIAEVPITISYGENTSTHNPVTHGTSVIFSTIKYTSIEHPLKFYGIPSVILLIIGTVLTYFAVQYYVDIGRLNTNLTVVSAGVVLVGIVLLITAILLYSLVSVVRENNSK